MKKLVKEIYKVLPFKKELFSTLKFFWKPKESIYRHLYFDGVFSVPVSKTDKFKIKHYGFQIENEIFWDGLLNGWEKESVGLWIKLCQKSELILDIGANTGVYSLIAKTINPKSKVYAFEPVNRVFSKLKENISLNNFDIEPIEKAVSNHDGTALIYNTSAEHTYCASVNKNFSELGTTVIETKIETITLNTFIRNKGIKKIDLIKIDVETHEPEVLEGFSDYLAQYKPTLLIEILNDEVGKKIYEIVHGLNYLFFNIDERGGIHQVDTITKSDFWNYLFCSRDIAIELDLIK